MGGHSPSAAYWYDHGSGRFVTSTYYMPTLPSWVVKFNRNSPVKEYCGRNYGSLCQTRRVETAQVFSEFEGGPDESLALTRSSWVGLREHLS